MVTTSRYTALVVVLAASLALLAPAASARPGDLDPSFAGTGSTTVAIDDLRAFGDLVAHQPDGKLIVAGFAQSTPFPSCVVARYLVDGQRDLTFGTTSGALTPLIGIDDCRFKSIAIRPDGRILLGGILDNGSPNDAQSVVAALTPNGALDTSFSGDGLFFENLLTGDEGVYDLSLLADGKLLAISSGSGASVVTRLKTDGTYDTGWAQSGQSGVGTGSMRKVRGLTDGRFLVAGKFSAPAESFRLSRLTVSGSNSSFDSSFGEADGHVTSDGLGGDSGLSSMLVQPDGKILLAGSGYLLGKYRSSLFRYSADGKPDATFGSGGVATVSLRLHDYIDAIALQPDGKIILGGRSQKAASPNIEAPFVARLNANGSLDLEFGTGGAIFDLFGQPQGSVSSVAVGPDGKISVVGTSTVPPNLSYFMIARLIGGEPADPPIALTSAISSPSKSKYKAKKFKKFSGTAAGDGLAKVQIAVLKSDSKLLKKKKRCLQLSSSKAKLSKYKAVKKKCVPSKWLNATGTTAWSYKLRKTLKAGKYTLYVRSLNTLGAPQSVPTKKSFTLTK